MARLSDFLKELAKDPEGSQTRRDWDSGGEHRDRAVDDYRDDGGTDLSREHRHVLKKAGRDGDLTGVIAECEKETPPSNVYLWVK